MSKRQLGESMSAAELQEWLEFFAYRHREEKRQQDEANSPSARFQH